MRVQNNDPDSESLRAGNYALTLCSHAFADFVRVRGATAPSTETARHC